MDHDDPQSVIKQISNRHHHDHGTYESWYLINRNSNTEPPLLFKNAINPPNVFFIFLSKLHMLKIMWLKNLNYIESVHARYVVVWTRTQNNVKKNKQDKQQLQEDMLHHSDTLSLF